MEPFLERHRLATAAVWDLHDGVVLVAAGDEIPVPGRGDRTYPFRAHSEWSIARPGFERPVSTKLR